MLRGFATVSYYATDLEAASAWYSGVLGIEPYFREGVLAAADPLQERAGEEQGHL
jgi:catechol 2,3-dioxygenase-like lactoylglutathione lyase family enzyme